MVEIMKVSEAEARLSELLAKAEKGETVYIARGDKPIVQLVPLAKPKKVRVPGRLSHWAGHDDRALLEPDPEQEAIDAGDFTDELGIWVGKVKAAPEGKKDRRS